MQRVEVSGAIGVVRRQRVNHCVTAVPITNKYHEYFLGVKAAGA